MSGFVTTVVGFTTFFKGIPKYLESLPSNFKHYVPSFLKEDLPSICERNIEPILVPVKHFLGFVDFCTTLKTVTDPDFGSKSVAQKGNAICRLVAGGIESFILVPVKLQWHNAASFLSSTLGTYSPYLQTIVFLDAFSIVGSVASIAGACFKIKGCSDEIKEANARIKLCDKNITLLKDVDANTPAPKMSLIVRKYVKESKMFFNKQEVSIYSPENFVNQYLKLLILEGDIKKEESNLVALTENNARTSKIERKSLQINAYRQKLEHTKEEILRINYLYLEKNANAANEARRQLTNQLMKHNIVNFLENQSSTREVLNNDDLFKKTYPNLNTDESKEKIKFLNQTLVADETVNYFTELLKLDLADVNVNLKDQLNDQISKKLLNNLDILLINKEIVDTNYKLSKKIDAMIPKVSKNLGNKIVKHIISYEKVRNKCEKRAQKSQKVKSCIEIAFESAKIALQSLSTVRPIAAIVAITLGVTLAPAVLAGVSIALFGAGLVISILGLTKCIYNCFYWIDPKTQVIPETHITELLPAV